MKGPDRGGRSDQTPISFDQRRGRGVFHAQGDCVPTLLRDGVRPVDAVFTRLSSCSKREKSNLAGEPATLQVDIIIDTVLANQISPTMEQHHRPGTRPCLCRVRPAHLWGEGGYVRLIHGLQTRGVRYANSWGAVCILRKM